MTYKLGKKSTKTRTPWFEFYNASFDNVPNLRNLRLTETLHPLARDSELAVDSGGRCFVAPTTHEHGTTPQTSESKSAKLKVVEDGCIDWKCVCVCVSHPYC